ncbi:putative ABC transporter ATP-binding protein YdiF [Nymphon striatum]|nr:putative ABC transporter ATP-binding protein YdiF [Nymphon striatum]
MAWNAKEQLQKAIPFYTSIEKKLNIKLNYKLPVMRRFASVEEQNLWFEACDKAQLEDFLSPKLLSNSNTGIDAPLGYGEVLDTGRIDTALLIAAYKKVMALKKNPFFEYLPMTSTKGEYLTIKAPELKETSAIKSSIFLIPWEKDYYRVGATYKWKDITNLPTEASKSELVEKLDKFLKCDYEIVDQVAGIRPTVTDRRPLVGRHPVNDNMFVLNGFGSRGVMIAPYASEQLVNLIERNEELHPEMDIERFTKKHFKYLIVILENVTSITKLDIQIVKVDCEYLFEEISFRLNGGDRAGLIGKNGAGKSTLLKLLTKDMAYDTGTIAMEKDVKIGFLRQDIDFEQGRTVLEEAYQAFVEIKALELQLDEINQQLVERTDYESGYNYQGETEKILQGLGFKREDFDKKTDTFSGGWRMRIELAKLLLQSNDVLLLDEPTNHLDIESIIWLENFLKGYPGAVVIVSHDKMFLDNVTNRTIEISLGRIYDYNKPYSEYLVLRDEMKQQQLNAQKNQEKEIQQAERLIEKFRAKSTKASMAQSLIKKLDKIERIEVDEDDNSVMNVRFPISITPGKVVTEIEELSKSYGEKHVLQNINLLIERDSKTAFVGQNGQGKSTLAKIMVGELEYEGHLKLGHNVQIGYFAQNQAEYLDGSKTVLDTMIDAANEKNRSKVRDILGSFLFRGDEVEKYVKVLSGGERNRLALAKMLLQPLNVLVMDEPTNHLDIKSKNVLKTALKNFEDQRVFRDIDYYLNERKAQDFRAIEKKQKTVVKKEKVKTGQNDFQDQKKLKSLKNKISSNESRIAELEKEIAEIDHDLLLNYDATIAKPNFFEGYQKKKDNLEELMKKWEQLTTELEKI